MGKARIEEMRWIYLFMGWITLACCGAAMAQEAKASDKQPLVDCHEGKVMLFDYAHSQDWRYAAGWTVRPHKGVKPVDWSQIDEMGPADFADAYLSGTGGYDYTNCFVDMQRKRSIDLPSDRPCWIHMNHGEMVVFPGPVAKGAEYCIVENETRFETENLFLVKIDRELSQMDLRPQLEKAVRPVLENIRPLYFKKMAVSYPNSEWDDVFDPPVFHATTVDIQFHADLPKSSYDQVTGWVTVDLPSGKVLKVACAAKRDDPIRDIPALAKADRELNEVYAALVKQIAGPRLTALKKEQMEWVRKKEEKIGDEYPLAGEDVTDTQFTRGRNKELLDSTRERTAELRKLLAK